MAEHIFTGFGFGPIQAGLFVNEAFCSGNFSHIVIAEVDEQLVDAVRANKGSYFVNISHKDGIEATKVEGIEILNPKVRADRNALIRALSKSTEIATCLPSVSFYSLGSENGVAGIISQGLQKSKADATIVYTAENNNRAAEILEANVGQGRNSAGHPVQYLNSVIGKMSRVVTGQEEIKQMNLTAIAPGIDRAFLVEEFNRIYVTKCNLSGFRPGIEVFIEKADLLPFEEAKLYGHNAIHALIAYLGEVKGLDRMTDVGRDTAIMKIGYDAFVNESGAALISKYKGIGEELFTMDGFRVYAEDLLERMTSQYLADTVERGGRDPVRKLGYNDRIFGTMALAAEQGIEPKNMALGAVAGIIALIRNAQENKLPEELQLDDWHQLEEVMIEKIIDWVWGNNKGIYGDRLIGYTQRARSDMESFVEE
ncbi:MAG: hypothetical protein JXB29_00475 [Sedimentisphaerales bacterium]|nr:hypothetical protein [Sedimentisphaerales bacterium]